MNSCAILVAHYASEHSPILSPSCDLDDNGAQHTKGSVESGCSGVE